MRFLLLIAGLLAFSCTPASIDINAKHPNDKREYRDLTLDNGLEVLLIADPNLKKSYASLSVGVGSMEDPPAHLGLMHLLEHMLFLGTKKYPDVGEYRRYIQANQGANNATTRDDRTVYFFSINHDALEGALDRFSQFFIAPTFDEKFLKREINAVDSEYKMKLKSDSWRLARLNRSLYKKNHPKSQFMIGSRKTLKGVNQEMMKEIFNKYYSASIMKLVVMGDHSLNDLEKMASDKFTPIKNNNIKRPIYSFELNEPNQLPEFLQIKPISDLKEINYYFAVPPDHQHWRTEPLFILSRLFGYSGEGSLLSFLKEKNLATNVYVGVGSMASYAGVYSVTVDLTEKGLKNYDEVTKAIFSYINFLKKQGYKKQFFKDQKAIIDIGYVFREQSEGMSIANDLSDLMHYYPSLNAEKWSSLLYDYGKEDFNYYLSFLRPDNMRVILLSKDVRTSLVEGFFGTEYHVDKISPEKITQWQSIQADPYFQYPKRNDYIPSDFLLISDDAYKRPYKLIDDERGVFWFQQDHEFKVPKGKLNFHFLAPKILENAKKHLLGQFYISLLNESLREWSAPLSDAGLYFGVDTTSYGILVSFSGFTEKMPKMMREVFQRLREIHVSEEKFEAIKKKIGRNIKNLEFRRASSHATLERKNIYNQNYFHYSEYTPHLEGITLDAVKKFANELYQEVSLEGAGYGSFDPIKLKKVLNNVFPILKAGLLAENKKPKERLIKIKSGSEYVFFKEVENNNHCWLGSFQFGRRTPQLNAAIKVLEAHLDNRFFADLRTKKQLGYIVESGKLYSEKMLGMYFLIQSADYKTSYLAGQVEGWLKKEAALYIESMREEELEGYKKALISNLKEPDRNLSQRLHSIELGAFYYDGEFDYKQELIAALGEVTKEDLKEAFQNILDPKKRKLLSIHIGAKGAQKPSVNKDWILNPKDFKMRQLVYE